PAPTPARSQAPTPLSAPRPPPAPNRRYSTCAVSLHSARFRPRPADQLAAAPDDQLVPERPQVREEPVAGGPLQVGDGHAAGAAGGVAEGTLHERHVLLAPAGEALVVVDQGLADQVEVGPRSRVNVEVGPGGQVVDAQAGGGVGVGLGQGPPAQAGGQRLGQLAPVLDLQRLEIAGVAQPRAQLQLPELDRLGARGGAQVAAELVQVPGGQGVEAAHLLQGVPEGVVDPPEQGLGAGEVAAVEQPHDPPQIVQEQLHPQLQGLVHDDEVQLL